MYNFTTYDTKRVIHSYPGITPPALCLIIGEHVWTQPSFSGAGDDDAPDDITVIQNLRKEHPEDWDLTCELVDELIDEGVIYMNDDGELRATG